MTDSATTAQRNPWVRRSIIILVVIAVLLIAGDIGNNLRTKSAATKAADATSSWTPNSEQYCTGYRDFEAAGAPFTMSSSPKLLSAVEALSVTAPTKLLHTQLSLLAQDLANLANDPSGLYTINHKLAAKLDAALEKSSDPKVVAYAKTMSVLGSPSYEAALTAAVTSCSPPITG